MTKAAGSSFSGGISTVPSAGDAKRVNIAKSALLQCSTVVSPAEDSESNRCGPANPCKGHLSTKSNAFCIDSCLNPISQYLIRDHLVFHYNKMLSAKAAVDCSAPKSRASSIKLADQQKREKLKKKAPKCEEKTHAGETVPQSCSTVCRRLPCSVRKGFLEDNLCTCAGQAQYLAGAACPHTKHCLACPSPVKHSCLSGAACPHSKLCVHCSSPVKHNCLSGAACPHRKHCLACSSPVKHPRKCSRVTCRASHTPSGVCLSKPLCKHPGLSRSHSADSFMNFGCCQKHHESNTARSSGDLLERHSECFTKSRKPFIPRTLVSDAKPFLSDYRYYNPARRMKKNRRKRHVEAQTQTDTISFPSAARVSVRRAPSEQKKMTSKAEDKRDTPDEPERGIDGCRCSILRETSRCPKKSSLRRTAEAEDEELLYLTFIEEITDEILRLGLFSNRVLDELFESYIEVNKNRLDEGKMRQMLDVLKSDLGCGQDSEELTHSGQETLDLPDLQECDTTEDLGFSSKRHSLTATKSEDLSLKEPSRCGSLSHSERSRGTQSGEDFSGYTTEIMDAGTESDFCGMEFEECPDTSHTYETDLNLMACDSDLGLSKEFDGLEEDFAGALHISHS